MRALSTVGRRSWRLPLRHRELLTQSAKMALAAVVAWLSARQVHEPQSFIAPYVAVFLISQTIYRSVLGAARQLAAIVLGVVLAFVVVTVVPYQLVALPVAVFVGMLLGYGRWLGDSGIWVGVVALLMVTSFAADDLAYLGYRIVESLIGAVVGTAINLLVLPPVRLRRAEQVLTEVSDEITALVTAVAEGLRGDRSDRGTAAWLDRARALDHTLDRARRAVGDGHESTRFNPHWRSRRAARRASAPPRFAAIDTLSEVTRQVQRVTETLHSAERAGPVVWPTDADFDERYARLLARLATGVRRYRSPGTAAEATAEVEAGLDDAERLAAEVTEPGPDIGWSARGALLVAVERAFRALRTDLAPGGG